jgi:hypothetical protein
VSIENVQNISYLERLENLRLHSLKGRRLEGDLIETYKIFHNLVDIEPSKVLTLVTDTSTRNSEIKIFIEHSITAKGRNTFRHRVAKYWNELPADKKKKPKKSSN